MKCRFCDGQVFVGHQVCHLDILVDDSGAFLDNMPGGAEASIYESNTPFGPFQCCGCGAVYDELKDKRKRPVPSKDGNGLEIARKTQI